MERTSGPKIPGPRGGNAIGPRELFVDDGDSQQAQVLPAQLCRHFEQPQSKLAGLGLEPLCGHPA